MNRYRVFSILLLATTFWNTAGCTTITPGGDQVFHSGPLRSQWTPTGARLLAPAKPFVDSTPRLKLAKDAEAKLENKQIGPGYGFSDVANMVAANFGKSCLPVNSPQELVHLAQKRGAYVTSGTPAVGDLVLFHNQVDANHDGLANDWYTGLAIVFKRRGDRLLVATRTGNRWRPVWLNLFKPATRELGHRPQNSFIKTPTPHDPVDSQYLAGQLYGGHIDTLTLVAKCDKTRING